MKVSYINDSLAIMWPDAMEDKTPYDIKQVVSDLLALRTAKDTLDFILKTPPSFFTNITYKPGPGLVYATDFDQWRSDSRLRGSIKELVAKDYPDIEVLDDLVVRSGELGPYVENYLISDPKDDDEVRVDIINPPKPYYEMIVSTIESLAFNLQAIARIGAIANGESSPDGLKIVELDCDVPVKIIDSCLSITSDFNKMPAQDPGIESYFSDKQIEAIKHALEESGQGDSFDHLYYGEGLGSLFLYPADTSDQDAAANIFTSFMNSLFEGNAETMYSGNIFKVKRGKRGFVVEDYSGPLRDMYRQCAYLVAANDIRLCAHCGKPLLADKSRGNEAMYCTRTCNTKASNARRETAYALAAAGVPIEEAIERIGQRYQQSIVRWYKESKALLD